ncbi:hypothetical protein L1987_20741 [Smallanthus sonchifolius]|uniref:Uncharacterized protein n=1 Tax=Smallanthus sonchifolius TaxID=185202 RepID=A0ACB9IT70_9ASTR|nr:hypothetical protein L1987_20741 [Smallanthus sonchifolius]
MALTVNHCYNLGKNTSHVQCHSRIDREPRQFRLYEKYHSDFKGVEEDRKANYNDMTLKPNTLTNITSDYQQQSNFAINLYLNAFQDAFKRLCPVRAKGHACGCLPTLAKKKLTLFV